MSYAHRPLNANASANSNSNTSTTSLRHPAGSSSNSQSHSYLQTRINAKRAELTHLLELRDLSANLAGQLGTLEEKLSTLKDGTQSVALVLANWENVLRAIGMAAMKVPQPSSELNEKNDTDGVNRDQEDEDGRAVASGTSSTQAKQQSTTQQLPVPLVRIPVQQKMEDDG